MADDGELSQETQSLSPFEARPNSPPLVAPGDCVGRYTLRERIGAGAMGDVYVAHDPDLDRRVALKILRGSMSSPEARLRFSREAQALARLNHPNVVAVFDVGNVGTHVFVAMELVSGPTLSRWIAGRVRAWREVVDVFLQAGEGLAAAHEAGIVHRDFKPANVMLGDRVRVVDFGLARMAGEVESSSSSGSSSLDLTVTQTGAWVGTPAYLAPEIRAGAPASPASDQYSFGVALHEALCGFRPQRGVEVAPGAPGHLRSLVARALAEDPAQRFPSMRALLEALRRDPIRERKRWLLGAAAVAVAAALGLVAMRHPVTPRCPDPAPLVAGLWDQAARERVGKAFADVGGAEATEMFQRADAAMSARIAAWARGHREACEATNVRHEASDSTLDARMRCLGRARGQIENLVALLGKPDATVVANAAQAASDVGDLEACADPASPVAPPDAKLAAEVDGVRQDLARVDTLRLVGHVSEEVEAADQALARAQATGYAPVIAAALAARGAAELMAAGDADRGMGLLYDAAHLAAKAGDDALVARAMVDAIFGTTIKQRTAPEEIAYRAAQAAVARAGDPPHLLALLYHNRAYALVRAGDFATAYALRIVLIPLLATGESSALRITNLGSLADIATKLGMSREARPMFDRALAEAERVLGPEHPVFEAILANAAGNRILGDDFDGAAELLGRGRQIAERVYGKDSPKVANLLHKLATARFEQRRLGEALDAEEQAIAINRARLGKRHPQLARNLDLKGSILLLAGKPAEALAELDEASAVGVEGFGPVHPLVADAERDRALALLDLDRVAEARAAVEKAIAIDKKTIGEKHADHGESLKVLADVAMAEKKPATALPLYRRATELIEGEVGSESPALVESLVGQCDALLASGDRGGAELVARRAVSLGLHGPSDKKAASIFCFARAEGNAADGASRVREARDKLAALDLTPRLMARMDAWLRQQRRR